MKHARKKERKYGSYTEKKNQSTEDVPEKAQIWDLLDQDFKSAILNMYKELKESMSKELKETTRTLFHQIEDINKELKIRKIEIME